MNNFAEYITPEALAALNPTPDKHNTVEAYRRSLKRWKGEKCQCGEDVWILSDTGLCFSCCTGEADASDDFELIEA